MPTSKMEFLYVIALFTTGVWCEQMQVIGRTNGEKISFDISFEEDFMIALTARQTDPPQPGYRQSINFYDFHKHLEARKLSDEDVCFIRPFVATHEQTRLVLENAKLSANKETDHVTENWNLEAEEILQDRLSEVVGEKIADFCTGCKVVWALQEPFLQEEQDSIEDNPQEPDDGESQQDDNELTAVHKVKRSNRLRTDVDADASGIRGRAEYGNDLLRAILRAEYGWDGSYGGNIGGRYSGRYGDLMAQLGYHSQRGYSGSVNYRNNNFNANAGFNYNRRNGLGFSAGFEIDL